MITYQDTEHILDHQTWSIKFALCPHIKLSYCIWHLKTWNTDLHELLLWYFYVALIIFILSLAAPALHSLRKRNDSIFLIWWTAPLKKNSTNSQPNTNLKHMRKQTYMPHKLPAEEYEVKLRRVLVRNGNISSGGFHILTQYENQITTGCSRLNIYVHALYSGSL